MDSMNIKFHNPDLSARRSARIGVGMKRVRRKSVNSRRDYDSLSVSEKEIGRLFYSSLYIVLPCPDKRRGLMWHAVFCWLRNAFIGTFSIIDLPASVTRLICFNSSTRSSNLP